MQEFTTKLASWERDIVKSYPLIYLEPNPNLSDWYTPEKLAAMIADPNFCNLRYGFEFERGWAGIVRSMSEAGSNIVAKLRETGAQPNAYISAFIFKEKFGVMTWQGDDNLIEPYKSMWRACVSYSEKLSVSTCEITGDPGTQYLRGSRVRTLSPDQAAIDNYIPTA